MNYKLLVQLIEKLEKYEGEMTQEAKIENFATWLASDLCAKENTEKQEQQNLMGVPQMVKVENHFNKEEQKLVPIEAEISRLVAMMYRYAKIYIKKAIENSALQTIDEFGYLAGTDMTGQTGISKTDLIARNIHEKTTGTEILKRLLKEGLLRQEDSQEDKRSKLLFITDKGRETFFGVLGKMHYAGLLINGNLTATEKKTLLALLIKLNDFHNPIFMENKENDLEELAGRFL